MFVERDQARVSAADAGMLHAVGLFETMTARVTGDGVVVESLDEHLDRLQSSACGLGLSTELKTGPLGSSG